MNGERTTDYNLHSSSIPVYVQFVQQDNLSGAGKKNSSPTGQHIAKYHCIEILLLAKLRVMKCY